MDSVAKFLNVRTFPFIIRDESGNVIYQELENDNWQRSEYNENGNLIFEENSQGEWKIIEYKNKNKIFCENGLRIRTFPSIYKETYYKEYDEFGNLIFEKIFSDNTSGWVRYQFDSDNNLTLKSFSSGIWEMYKYNNLGLLTYTESSCDDGSPGGSWEKRKYDQHGNLIEVKNSEKYTEWYTYSENNILQLYQNSDNISRAYDEKGRIISDHDGDGTFINYTYNDLDNTCKVDIDAPDTNW